MTHPLTPREKVARIVDPWAFSIVANIQHTERAADDQGKALTKADDIITALASGSGDHVELALNAKAAQTWALGIYENREQAERRSKFIDSDLPATVLTLLTENAAMRVQVETENRLSVENYSRATARATEAERKLAEAVGMLRRIVETPSDQFDEKAEADKLRAFLSKEAERG